MRFQKYLLFILMLFLITFVSAEYCYQESATVSTPCGGLSGGGYTPNGTWLGSFPPENFYDGDWGSATYGLSINHIDVTYEIPVDYPYGSIWRVKHHNITEDIIIPSGCFYQGYLSLRAKTAYFNTVPSTRLSQLYCYNGNEWLEIGTTFFGEENLNSWLYEEAMLWRGPNIVNVTPYEVIILPQVTSTIPRDVEGLTRTYLFCTWRIDNLGEEVVMMNSNLCPEVAQTFTFEGDETYYARVEAVDIFWNGTDWEFNPPETSGILEINYDMDEPPEPSPTLFTNIYTIILNKIKGWICQIFPFLGICS